ncbi:MAG: acetate kinase [Lentimicrobiaceae bacterium]|jgi:acetate kinase|nr:acetate kinase [Lentimicrobiaceae bacterium]
MKTIVLNCGSSSIKYQLFDMPEATVLAKGLVEKIGLSDSLITHKRNDGQKTVIEKPLKNHQEGIAIVLDLLTSKETGSVANINEIGAVGHRVVHAGEKFSGSVLITQAVIEALQECIGLAPLHNPANLEGVFAMQKVLPNVPQVGVFDTAFHQTMPEKSYLYGIPYALYEKYAIRRYGFHGTSHKYVSKKACETLGLDINKQKIITCHLGNGASIAAIDGGKSVDTSMGMTPIEGLIMGTRCGDLDVGALIHIAKVENLDFDGLNTLVNKKSGVFGVSGISSDMRDLESAAKEGNKRAALALEMYQYRVKKYIGSYAAAMGGVDLIIFTGGIGENDTLTRTKSVEGLEFMGVKVDIEKSMNTRGKEIVISTPDSKTTVMVVPTDEELMIATDTYEIVTK